MTSRVFWDISTNTDEADASRALSSNSLTMEHGSVMTDVEPIARTVFWGRAVIGIVEVYQGIMLIRDSLNHNI